VELGAEMREPTGKRLWRKMPHRPDSVARMAKAA
jgi:hypothetical protein